MKIFGMTTHSHGGLLSTIKKDILLKDEAKW